MNCKECGCILDPLTGMPSDTAEHRELSRIKEGLNDILRLHIIAVRTQDKTPDYGYGNHKSAQNRFGKPPGPGSRWLTPIELVEVLRQDINKLIED